jgi:hypothetical protein
VFYVESDFSVKLINPDERLLRYSAIEVFRAAYVSVESLGVFLPLLWEAKEAKSMFSVSINERTRRKAERVGGEKL